MFTNANYDEISFEEYFHRILYKNIVRRGVKIPPISKTTSQFWVTLPFLKTPDTPPPPPLDLFTFKAQFSSELKF